MERLRHDELIHIASVPAMPAPEGEKKMLESQDIEFSWCRLRM
jgi:hypothetical protein